MIEPSCGELVACSETSCELSVNASGPGSIDEDVVCHLGHVDETVSLHVSAVVKKCELLVDEAELDFGLIRFGESATRTLTVNNPGRSPVDWSIQLSPSVTSEVDVEEFNFCPSSGIIWPLGMCIVEVTLHPKQCRTLNALLELVSADGDKMVVCTTADVQRPQVCLLKSSIHTDTYLNATTPLTPTLFNQTALSTRFEWGEVTCVGAADIDVTVEPKSGVIESREQVTISVSITPHTVEPLRSVIIPCTIEGMAEPVNLSITADVYELNVSVTYSVSSDMESWLTGDGVLIDFGGNNLLHETPKMYMRIQNSSGIASDFRLELESFPSAVTAEKLKLEAGCDENRPARLLKKTANIADPSAKTGAKSVKELRAKMLAGGSGVAFHLNPSSGELPPFTERIIEITAYADLWGFYSDLLHCHIGNVDLFTVPVLMSIVDSPILFQMVSHEPSLKPIMRFGCVVDGTSPLTRRTRILNGSPVDIRIDWQTFNITADDDQLLDLVVVHGNPFPLKDKNGKEVILSCDVSGNLTEDKFKQLAIDEAAVEERAALRPQIISLNLREHSGTEATVPYSIEPSQLVRTEKFTF